MGMPGPYTQGESEMTVQELITVLSFEDPTHEVVITITDESGNVHKCDVWGLTNTSKSDQDVVEISVALT